MEEECKVVLVGCDCYRARFKGSARLGWPIPSVMKMMYIFLSFVVE